MTYSHTQGLHILPSDLPEFPAGQSRLVGSRMGLRAAGQVTLLMLCHVMHSLMGLSACPAGSPDPPYQLQSDSCCSPRLREQL